MPTPRNLIVAQSGGPSPVINNSLRGIVEAARENSAIGTVFGARHGIEGVLKEELLNLTDQPDAEIALLKYTPAAGSIGTCRYKMRKQQSEDFDRVIEVLRAHSVGYFLYIGGNDSMDTAHKIAALAHRRGLELVAVGVPKTIDNDVGDREFKLIDHTPGYGSVARFWMHMVQCANEENAGLVAGGSGPGHAGHGPQDWFHSGGGAIGRSRPGAATADLSGREPLYARAVGRSGQRSVAPPAAARWSSSAKGSTLVKSASGGIHSGIPPSVRARRPSCNMSSTI